MLTNRYLRGLADTFNEGNLLREKKLAEEIRQNEQAILLKNIEDMILKAANNGEYTYCYTIFNRYYVDYVLEQLKDLKPVRLIGDDGEIILKFDW
jgi:hypothetical protein